MIARIPDPFAPTSRYTEWTVAQRFAEWINEIIKEEDLPLDRALTETKPKRPDILILSAKKAICIIEMKLPFTDVFAKDPYDPAFQKADEQGAPYFCTCNINTLIWFSTERAKQGESLSQQIINHYNLANIQDPDLIDEPDVRITIKSQLKEFLNELVQLHTGQKPIPKIPIDEFLIYRLQASIEALTAHYKHLIKKKAQEDPEFSRQLQSWFVEQVWNFAFQDQDYEKAGRQAAYLLINKILFYTALQQKHHLDPLNIPEDLTDGGILKKFLEAYFDKILTIDYETIFSTDFIDRLAFPNVKEAVSIIKGLIRDINRYKVAEVGYDVIGRIFEGLIPQEERHKLGQYFTNADIVDIILRFCLAFGESSDFIERAKLFDPACGAGTFLVRAYQHKRLSNPRLKHEKILSTIWGTDIAKFPAHLATINLAVNDLGSDENYPRIIRKDFFELLPDTVEFGLPQRKVGLVSLGKGEKIVEHPRYFDAVIGNPPYTRQEEMEDIAGAEGYKKELIKKAIRDAAGKQIAAIPKRAGIYAYFFIHGFKFLQNGGRFGFIVSNSWLDVDYGKGVQEFFLKNYKILAIIESKVERWFPDADVNTCIVILEKCSGEKRKKTRGENLVRFIQLLKPLRHFIPPAEDMWSKEAERLHRIDLLIQQIMSKHEFYQSDDLKVFPKSQKELWEEGYDEDKKRYVGSKWGRYLRAPDIFFKVLEKGKGKLVPLKEIAGVKRGFTTGANEFFYLTEEEIKRWGIEKEFWMHKDEQGNWVPNYVIKSPRECKSILVDPKDLKYRVLMIHKDKEDLKGTNVLKYVEWGESQGFHERPTCANRKRWYDLGKRGKPSLVWIKGIWDRHFLAITDYKCYADQQLYEITLNSPKQALIVAASLNSTFTAIFAEFNARLSLGEGILWIATYEAANMIIVHPDALNEELNKKITTAFGEICKRPILPVFEELGAHDPKDVTLEGVKPDRRELDKIIMGEILGLSEEEQLEVYQAVIDLVKSRIEKAQSIPKRPQTKEGINIEALVETALAKVRETGLFEFYREKILPRKTHEVSIPSGKGNIEITNTLMGWEVRAGRQRISCKSEAEARYLKGLAELGLSKVLIPEDETYLSSILEELESKCRAAQAVVHQYLNSIVDKKLRQNILNKIAGMIRKEMG